jgi:sulfate permease, SulP family
MSFSTPPLGASWSARIARNLRWSNLKTESLAGITVALALIPESLAFAAIAQVNPMVALYTSFCMAVVIAIAGGRPAMISAATGSMALVMTTLVAKHGVEYLFAATILTGLLQFLIGVCRLEKFFSFIPQSVIAGFVNALGISILVAQFSQFKGESWPMYVMVAVTLAIVYLFPRISKAIPSPLVAIVAMTVVAIGLNLDIRRVGDIGEITRNLPTLHIPQVPWTLETLGIILPYAVTLALVGLLESLLTAALLDDMTHTQSSRNQETRGQGIANIVTGLLGGMAGCGMVGQSIINVRSKGKGRLSTMIAGAFLLFSIFVLRDTVQQIPMAALVGVMIMVSLETMDWRSIRRFRQVPWPEAVVMPFTVGVVLLSHDLAKGVLAGLILNVLLFGWQAAQIRTMTEEQEGIKVYHVSGQLFFGSATPFVARFDWDHDPAEVVIDLHRAQLWDHGAAEAIAKIMAHYQRLGKRITLTGLSPESYTVAQRAGIAEALMHKARPASKAA